MTTWIIINIFMVVLSAWLVAVAMYIYNPEDSDSDKAFVIFISGIMLFFISILSATIK